MSNVQSANAVTNREGGAKKKHRKKSKTAFLKWFVAGLFFVVTAVIVVTVGVIVVKQLVQDLTEGHAQTVREQATVFTDKLNSLEDRQEERHNLTTQALIELFLREIDNVRTTFTTTLENQQARQDERHKQTVYDLAGVFAQKTEEQSSSHYENLRDALAKQTTTHYEQLRNATAMKEQECAAQLQAETVSCDNRLGDEQDRCKANRSADHNAFQRHMSATKKTHDEAIADQILQSAADGDERVTDANDKCTRKLDTERTNNKKKLGEERSEQADRIDAMKKELGSCESKATLQTLTHSAENQQRDRKYLRLNGRYVESQKNLATWQSRFAYMEFAKIAGTWSGALMCGTALGVPFKVASFVSGLL